MEEIQDDATLLNEQRVISEDKWLSYMWCACCMDASHEPRGQSLRKDEMTEMRMIRWMCGVSLKERQPSTELRRRPQTAFSHDMSSSSSVSVVLVRAWTCAWIVHRYASLAVPTCFGRWSGSSPTNRHQFSFADIISETKVWTVVEAIEDVMRRGTLRWHGYVERNGDADNAQMRVLGWWWWARLQPIDRGIHGRTLCLPIWVCGMLTLGTSTTEQNEDHRMTHGVSKTALKRRWLSCSVTITSPHRLNLLSAIFLDIAPIFWSPITSLYSYCCYCCYFLLFLSAAACISHPMFSILYFSFYMSPFGQSSHLSCGL